MDKKTTSESHHPKDFVPLRVLLLGKIEEYLKTHPHMSPEGFGWATIKDCALVERLRAGKDITTRKFDDILIFISTHQKKE